MKTYCGAFNGGLCEQTGEQCSGHAEPVLTESAYGRRVRLERERREADPNYGSWTRQKAARPARNIGPLGGIASGDWEWENNPVIVKEGE